MLCTTWRCFTAATVAAAAIPYRFVASDMDGSILSPDHTLTEYASETLRRLTQERHVPFIFATGRYHADVAAVNRDLQAFFAKNRQTSANSSSSAQDHMPSYIITSNGAVIHNAQTAQIMLERPIAPDLVREIYTLLPASETRINTGMIMNDRWLCRMNWEEMLQYHKQSGCRYDVAESLPSAATSPDGDLTHVHKIFFSSWDRSLLEKLERLLQEKYGTHLTVTFSASYNVDITAKGVTKASALEQLYRHLPQLPGESAESATAEQRLRATVAFGDDLNDAAMLASVGKGCVMGNCNPQLMSRCPQLEVIGTNAEDSVVRKLREIFHLE